MSLAPGTVVHARFRLQAAAGSGGVSTVWRAIDERDGGEVALKVLHPHLRSDRVIVERFRREAALLAKLSHPAIVRGGEVFEDAEAVSFSMEHVDGTTVKDRVLASGPMPVAEAMTLARTVLGALAAAHAGGVVHRDVKSQNLLLTRDGGVKVLDFGFARVDALAGLTARSLVLGTPEYAAPEQIEGRPVDGRADLYSLGVVLFEALTGRLPFRGGSAYEILRAHLTGDVPSIRSIREDVPAALDEAVRRLLEKKPEKRFATCEEALVALDEPIPEPRIPSAACAACGSPRESGWPLCPACGSSGEAAARGDWMVVLVRVPESIDERRVRASEPEGRPSGIDAAASLREAVRSIGAEPAHELAAGSPETTKRLPKVLVKGVGEALAKLLRDRCVARDLQVELRRTTENNVDLLYRSAMPAYVFVGGAAIVWLAVVGAAVRNHLSIWAAGGELLAASVGIGAALASGPALYGLLRRHAHRLLPPLATIATESASVPLPAATISAYRAALAAVREESLRGTLRRLLERALAIQHAASSAPEHLLGVLEEPRSVALGLVEEAARLAIAAQGQLDRLAACNESAVRDEIAALQARHAAATQESAKRTLEGFLAEKHATLAEIAELERAQAESTQRLLRVASGVELATVRLLAASAPDATGASREIDRLSLQADAAVRTARAMAGPVVR